MKNEQEDLKKNQMKLPQMENIFIKIKKWMGISSKVDMKKKLSNTAQGHNDRKYKTKINKVGWNNKMINENRRKEEIIW